MAEIAGKHVQQVAMNGSNEADEEKWAKHYSSNHQILLVGEGDFSFSLSLAKSFGSASNIVASSLDSYDTVIKKYKKAKKNLETLGVCGAQLLHGVDATKMKLHPDLRIRKFDRIVYNFPHAGFLGKEDNHMVITMHRNLVRRFLRNASGMLRPNGEVHISHKTNSTFSCWNIEELAFQSCLALLECVEFKIKDYPPYKNKRGAGCRPDESFPLGKCCTFKFILSSTAKRSRTKRYTNPQRPQEIPLQRADARMVMNHAPVTNANELFRVFREYFDVARSMYGQADMYLYDSVPNVLYIAFTRYTAENRGNPLDGYLNVLEELQNLSKKRVEFLENRLWEIDHQHCF